MNSPKITIRLPQKEIDNMDLLIRAGLYKDRSEFAREAIIELLNETVPSPPGRKEQ